MARDGPKVSFINSGKNFHHDVVFALKEVLKKNSWLWTRFPHQSQRKGKERHSLDTL